MRISSKCSVSLHILLLLAAFPQKKLTSEVMARSTGCNPVVIRTLLGKLKRAGLVEVRQGSGGAALLRPPEEITLRDICRAVDPVSPQHLLARHPSPSQACPVGKSIYALLDKPCQDMAQAVEATMEQYTLGQFLAQYRAMTQAPS